MKIMLRKYYHSPQSELFEIEIDSLVCASLPKGNEDEQPYEPEAKERSDEAGDTSASPWGDLW